MLVELSVENLGLIEGLSLEFGPGLTVLTGETGAGKSLIIGALALLSGGRGDASLIRSGASEARVSALFSHGEELGSQLEEWGYPVDGDVVAARSISRDGRNRCWLGGRPATLRQLTDASSWLMDLHGQHEQQRLLDRAGHLDYLDRYVGDAALALRKRFSALLAGWKGIEEEACALREASAERERRIDFLSFQLAEIEAAGLKEGEEEALSAEREICRHAGRLIEEAGAATALLAGDEAGLERGAPLLDALRQVRMGLGRVSAFDPEMGQLTELVDEAQVRLEEVARSLVRYPERIDFSPERLEGLEERLDQIARLKRKYGATVEEVLEHARRIGGDLEGCASSEARLGEMEIERDRTAGELADAGGKLSVLRSGAAASFSGAVVSELEELGLPSVLFEVQLSRDRTGNGIVLDAEILQPHAQGFDRAEFLISANPGEPAASLRRIASGGEVSRAMLAIKTALGAADSVPTLVFDEVDAGIGGRMAALVGAKLARLGRLHQVICVTHLPQIGCFADRHFIVTKEVRQGRRVVVARPLSSQERVEELARMLSGELSPELSRAHAKELLEDANQRKATVRAPALK